MGLFAWLFGKADDRPSIYDPNGSIVIIVQSAGSGLAEVLRADGRSVTTFEHGAADLIDQLASSARACVVIEVESPRMNGFLISKRVRSDARLRGVPIVLFSAEVDEQTFAQHEKLRARADAYVVGNDPRKIADAVRPLLASSRPG